MNIKSELTRIAKFSLVSLFSFVVHIAVMLVIDLSFDINFLDLYHITMIFGVLCNYCLNRKFTFKSKNSIPVSVLKVFAYYLVLAPLSLRIGNAVSEYFLEVGYFEYIFVPSVLVINIILEYPIQRYFVFGKSKD